MKGGAISFKEDRRVRWALVCAPIATFSPPSLGGPQMEGDNEAAQLREVVWTCNNLGVSGEYVVRWRLKPAIGVVLQLVLWFVSELYTYCFSLVLCGVWLYSILLLKIFVPALTYPRSF